MVDDNWYGSPLELHSELMVGRKKLVNELKSKGVTQEEAIKILQNPREKDLVRINYLQSLDNFFKPNTSKDIINTILKAMPIGAGVAVGLDKLNKNNSKN